MTQVDIFSDSYLKHCAMPIALLHDSIALEVTKAAMFGVFAATRHPQWARAHVDWLLKAVAEIPDDEPGGNSRQDWEDLVAAWVADCPIEVIGEEGSS